MMMLRGAGGLACLVLAGCGGGGGPASCAGGQGCGPDGGLDGAGADAPGADVTPADGAGADGQPSGDGEVAGACGSVQPCGGELAGDWAVGQECQSADRIAAAEADFATMIEPTWCAVARLVGIAPEASGSWRFDGTGTYSLDLAFGGSLDINYPASCFVPSFHCDDLTAELQSDIDAGTFPLSSVSSISCAGSSSCLCHATVSYEHTESGTYAVSGGVVTLTPATGAVTSDGYCVQGNTLHILDTATETSGRTTVESDLVAVKRP